MRLKVMLLVSILVIWGAADALTFNQNIFVEGNGNLSARTNTEAAKDAVVGSGEQQYLRNLILDEGNTTLTSKYNLVSNLTERKNRYYVQMNSQKGLDHFISIESSSDIDSSSSIYQSGSTAITEYVVGVKMGKLSEGITYWDDYEDGKTGRKIADTEVSGNFTMRSQLSDEERRKPIPGWSADKLLEQLDNAAKLAETVPPEEQVFAKLRAKAEQRMDEEDEFVTFTGERVTPELVVAFEGLPLGLYAKIYRSGDTEPKIYEPGKNRIDRRPMIFLGGRGG